MKTKCLLSAILEGNRHISPGIHVGIYSMDGYCFAIYSALLEQNKIFSHNFNKCVNLKCPLQTIWIEDQAHRNVGPDLRPILFDTQHQFLLKTGCIVWDYLKYVAIYFL